MLETLKSKLICLLNELPKNNLVCLTSGNVSIRDVDTGLVLIKPSGIPFSDILEEDIVILKENGEIVEGKRKPSSDTFSHLYIYRNMKKINGIVHTHSCYATCFAALGWNIPVFFTETAEEFGGEIPCSDFVLIGDEQIGEQVVRFGKQCNSILLKKHGVFTIAETGRRAVDLAILTENSARIAWLALQLGQPEKIDPQDIEKLFDRQQNVYGQ
jgi:L-ribulose-5-phosphate 4-epimerase